MEKLFLGKFPHFKPAYLPANAKKKWDENVSSPKLWREVIVELINYGITDLNALADVAFYLFNPKMIGTPLSKGMRNFEKLAGEWNFLRRECAALTKKCHDTPASKTLADELEAIPVNSLGRDNRQWEAIRRMKPLLIRGLRGDPVHVQFRKFSGKDGFGREFEPFRRDFYPVITLKPHPTIHSAVELLERHALKMSVKNAIEEVELTIFENMDMVMRWVESNQSTADARLDSHAEIKFVKDLYRLANQEVPQSIFRCYKRVITEAYRALF